MPSDLVRHALQALGTGSGVDPLVERVDAMIARGLSAIERAGTLREQAEQLRDDARRAQQRRGA